MADNSVAGTISAEQRVFYMHPTKGWSLGVVEALYADTNATSPIAAVTSNNAHTLKLAIITDEASGASERVLVNVGGGITTTGKATSKFAAANGVDNVIHPYMDGAYNPLDNELFRVNDLHISTLLYCLKDRYERMQLQYSWLGETIISVNPFAAMAYNGPAAQQQYLTALKQGGGAAASHAAGPTGAVNLHASATPSSSPVGGAVGDIPIPPVNPATGLPLSGPLPPHVWHIAEKAFAGAVVRGDGHQSVVVSGESGSGKTENTKAIIDFLGQLSALHSCNAVQKQLADTVSNMIKACNPILESFGNAKTVRNDNSSRFGKYTKLFFNRDSGVIVGGGLVTYLLEKSRIVIQGPKERNYHVFYELLDACNTATTTLPSALIGQLGLQGKKPQDFAILVGGTATGRVNKDEPSTRRGTSGTVVSDAKEFQAILTAMQQMQVPQPIQESIWKCIAAIMHLGEINFLTSESNGKAMLDEATKPSLARACTLLGLDEKGSAALLQVFLEKSRTKILTTMATQSEAEGLRDAYSKALYVAIFDWLVTHINKALKVKDMGMGGGAATEIDVTNNKAIAYIGVLDIFGFENFQTNSFEQLCINFANETLQGHYNRFTFLNDEEECKREGVPSPQVTFPDNSPCLRLFDTAKTGIFAALDEESSFKGGTSDRFTQLLWDQWAPQGANANGADEATMAARERFGRPKGTIPDSFSVSHFAATVEYKTAGWLEKNSDTLKEEAAEATAMSSNAFIAALLPFTPAAAKDDRGPPKKKPSVAKHFQKQLSELMAELTNTMTHFVRCIKPNMPAQPKHIDNGHVGSQLESAGVVQTVALKRQGYPIRRPIEQFVKNFRCLCPNVVAKLSKGSPSEQANGILGYIANAYGWSPAGIEDRKVRLTAYLKEKQMASPTNNNKGGKSAAVDMKAIAEEVARLVPPYPYCVVGHSKVFLKPIAWSKLELLRKRYNMGRLRKCAPHLRRWVGRYRERKAEAERQRLAELKRLQDEAEARRQTNAAAMAASVAAAGGNPANAAELLANNADALNHSMTASGLQSGLTEQKAMWFAEIAGIFVHFDIPILLDVIYNLETKEQAIRALEDMQKQRLDMTLPAPFRRMLQEMRIRDGVVEQLAASNIASVAQLGALSRNDLRQLGFNDTEIAAVASRMLSQQSQLVVTQRMYNEYGGSDMGALTQAMNNTSNNTNMMRTPLAQQQMQQQQQQQRPVSPAAVGAGKGAAPSASAAVSSAATPQRSPTTGRHADPYSAPPSAAANPTSRPPASSSAAVDNTKVSRMLELGIGNREACVAALQITGGDLQAATNFMLTGERPVTSVASGNGSPTNRNQQHPNGGASNGISPQRSPQQGALKPPGTRAPPTAASPHYMPPHAYEQQQQHGGGLGGRVGMHSSSAYTPDGSFSAPPPVPTREEAYAMSMSDTSPPPPGRTIHPGHHLTHINNAPQQQQHHHHQAPPHPQRVVAATTDAHNNSGSTSDITNCVDQSKLKMLCEMGFGKAHAAMALMQTNGNVDKAMDLLMQ